MSKHDIIVVALFNFTYSCYECGGRCQELTDHLPYQINPDAPTRALCPDCGGGNGLKIIEQGDDHYEARFQALDPAKDLRW